MRQIVCNSCFNKEICRYVEKANELFKELEEVVDKYGLGENSPVTFGLSVTCPKYCSKKAFPTFEGIR